MCWTDWLVLDVVAYTSPAAEAGICGKDGEPKLGLSSAAVFGSSAVLSIFSRLSYASRVLHPAPQPW